MKKNLYFTFFVKGFRMYIIKKREKWHLFLPWATMQVFVHIFVFTYKFLSPPLMFQFYFVNLRGNGQANNSLWFIYFVPRSSFINTSHPSWPPVSKKIWGESVPWSRSKKHLQNIKDSVFLWYQHWEGRSKSSQWAHLVWESSDQTTANGVSFSRLWECYRRSIHLS